MIYLAHMPTHLDTKNPHTVWYVDHLCECFSILWIIGSNTWINYILSVPIGMIRFLLLFHLVH